jgi:hypothetical protein
MPKRQPRPSVNRRQVLQRLAIAGITVTGGYILYEYQPWLNYDRQAQDTWKSLKRESVMSAQLRELVRSATLAASGHNTQPWKFAIKENAIEIHPDYSRRLPIVDPVDRELWMSLGCVLENLLVAALRGQFQSAIGLGNDLPQLLIRFGYGKSMPQSLRRPVERVLV